MRGTTHSLGGAAAVLAVALPFSPPFLSPPSAKMGVVLGAAVLGGLLPDIDHSGSKLGRKVKPVSSVIQHTVGHRTFTHSLLFLLLVAGGCAWLGLQGPLSSSPELRWSALGVVVGCLSHLILDAMTVSGVPLLLPFSDHAFRFPLHVKTGGMGEVAVTVGLVVVLSLLVLAVKGG
ncbi:MAG: metal-dependent hydrolase [Candidatus Hadarchaeales archaeon]